MQSFTSSQIYAALAAQPPERAEALLQDEAVTMTAEEQFVYNAIQVELKQGERQAYFALSSVPLLPGLLDCVTAGREIWGNKAEVDGKYKMSIEVQGDALNVLQLYEALICLKIGQKFPDSPDAQRLASGGCETNINAEYSQLKADLTVPPSRYPVSLYRQLHNSSVVAQVPQNCILSPFDEGGLPTVNKELDPDTRKPVRTAPIQYYAMDVEVQPTIAIMNRLKWQVKRVTVKAPVERTGVFRKPVQLSEMANPNTTWTIAPAAKQGGYGNYFHPMTHSLSPNQNFSSSFWLTGEEEGEEEGEKTTIVPLKVAHVWSKQDENGATLAQPTEATLALAGSKDATKRIRDVCANIKDTVASSLPNLQKKYKPPKTTAKGKPKLDWSAVLNFTEPQIKQTEEKIEKWGARTDEWYKLPVCFKADPQRAAKETPIYVPDGILKQNPDAIPAKDLLTSDPKKLVKDGMLQLASSNDGFSLGKGAEVFAAVCVSKVNTAPKFSYAFRTEYIIALSQGDLGGDGSGEMELQNGTIVKPERITDFAAAMRADKRKREPSPERVVSQRVEQSHAPQEDPTELTDASSE